MVEMGEKFLPREDKDASHLVQEQMKKDGVNLLFKTTVQRLEKLDEQWAGQNRVRVHYLTRG